MKEPIEQLEEIVRSEIDQLKSDNTSLPDGDKKLVNTIRAIAFSDVLIKILELNEAYHNAAIDALIEQGRIAESIKHYAASDGITNDTQQDYQHLKPAEQLLMEEIAKNKIKLGK